MILLCSITDACQPFCAAFSEFERSLVSIKCEYIDIVQTSVTVIMKPVTWAAAGHFENSFALLVATVTTLLCILLMLL